MELTTTYQLIGEKVVGEVSGNKTTLRLYGKYNSIDLPTRTASVSFKAVAYVTKGYITLASCNGAFRGDYTDNFSFSNKTFNVGETTLKEITKPVTFDDSGRLAINIGLYFYDSYYRSGTQIPDTEVTIPPIQSKSNLSLKLEGTYHKVALYVKDNGTYHKVTKLWVKDGVYK